MTTKQIQNAIYFMRIGLAQFAADQSKTSAQLHEVSGDVVEVERFLAAALQAEKAKA